MHVHVDKAGTDDKTGWNLDYRGAIGRKIPTDASDAAVLDEDVVHAIDPIRGIDDMPALKQPLHVQLRPPEIEHRHPHRDAVRDLVEDD